MIGILIALVIAIPVAFVLGGLCGYRAHYNQVETDLRLATETRRTNLSKRGGTIMVPGAEKYYVKSFDGGRNWFAVERIHLEVVPDEIHVGSRDEFELRILGPADVIFPGLMRHLLGMDSLVRHIRNGGKITLSGPQDAA